MWIKTSLIALGLAGAMAAASRGHAVPTAWLMVCHRAWWCVGRHWSPRLYVSVGLTEEGSMKATIAG